MSVTVTIPVEDISDELETYTSIQLERAASAGGSFSLVDTLTLVAGTYYYSSIDASGTLNSWYRYRFYNATGPNTSDYSNPFQPDAVTRKKIRQEALEANDMGMVLTALASGSSSTVIPTNDYRFKSSLYRTDRGKGGWLYFTSGNHAGEIVRVTGTNPTAGTFTLSPALAAVSLVDGDEFEWHWVADPATWNRAINRGLGRSWFLDRVPFAGNGTSEIILTDYLPWLLKKEWVTGLWWFPIASAILQQGTDSPFNGEGRWWQVRQDAAAITLQISPALQTTETVYLEAVRPEPPLFTDDSQASRQCALELAAALAYDEVLDVLTKPGAGAAKDVESWNKERTQFCAQTLNHLLLKYAPRPRFTPPQGQTQPSVPQPFTSR